jgi:hypothetical protein
MLKKTLIGLVLLTTLGIAIVPATAGHIKAYTWPCEFKFLDLAEIPVYLDVGLYVEILDQDQLRIKLEQEDIDTYSGCVTFQIKSNFGLILGCYTKDNDASKAMGGSLSCEIKPDVFVPKTLCETVAEREVCVTYDEVAIVHHDFGKNILVGSVVIQVKPGWECEWVDP